MSNTAQTIDIPSRTIFSYDRSSATLTLTIPGGCGAPEEKKECFYDVSSKSWKTKITTSYNKVNAPNLTDNEFKAQCVVTTKTENGCSVAKDCVVGVYTKEGACANSTDPVKLKYPITQNPSATGKGCIDVVKAIDSNTTATVVKEGEFIVANKKCSDINSSSSGSSDSISSGKSGSKPMIIAGSVGVLLLIIVVMFMMKKKK